MRAARAAVGSEAPARGAAPAHRPRRPPPRRAIAPRAGASTVSRTVLSASEPADGKAAGKAAAGKKRPSDRAALTLAN